MKQIIAYFLLCCVPVYASSIAAQASGSYLATGTWAGGVVPGAGDTVTVGSNLAVTCSGTCAAQTVTLTGATTAQMLVASGGAMTVGASTANTVITVGAGTDFNVQSGATLTFGNRPATDQSFNLTPGLLILGTFEFAGTVTALETVGPKNGGQLLCHGGGLMQFNPPTSGIYVVMAQSGSPYGQVNSDASSWSSPCTIRTQSGAAGSNFWFHNFSTAFSLIFNLNYTDLTNGCGDGSYCVDDTPRAVMNHVRFGVNGLQYRANTGGADANDGYQLSYVSFRNISSSASQSAWLSAAGVTGCPGAGGTAFSCSADHISTWATGDGLENKFQIDTPGYTVANSVFVGAFYEPSAGLGVVSNTVFSASDVGSTAGFVYPKAGGGTKFLNDVWLYVNCPANTGMKCHGVEEAGTVGTVPTLFADIILDGGGYPAGSTGNWEIPNGAFNVERMLAINGYASISDAIGTTTYDNVLSHVTSVAANTAGSPPSGGEAPLSQEISTHPYQWGAFHNSINSSQLFSVNSGAAVGGFQPQYTNSATANGCNFAVTSNVVMVSGCTNTFNTGAAPHIPVVTCTGLTKNAWLNGVTMTPTGAITGTGWTATISDYTHANYSALAETTGTCYAGFYYDDNVSYNVNPAGYANGFNAWNQAKGVQGSMFPNATTASRLTFVSNASSNAGCTNVQTSGTNAGTIVGDFLFKTSSQVGPALVLTVPSSTVLTTDGNGGISGNCTNTTGMSVVFNFWTSGKYGDAGKGANEQIGINPSHYCPTCSSASWDGTLSGGNSTLLDARNQLSCNISELIGPTGTACTADTNATIANLQGYLKRAYTPYNNAMGRAPDGNAFGAYSVYPAAIIQ